jgi:hypothetical protein
MSISAYSSFNLVKPGAIIRAVPGTIRAGFSYGQIVDELQRIPFTGFIRHCLGDDFFEVSSNYRVETFYFNFEQFNAADGVIHRR